MKTWLMFTKTDDDITLSVFGVLLIKPKRLMGIVEFSSARCLVVAKPAKGRILPYIGIRNMFGIDSKSFGCTQEMVDEITLTDLKPNEDAVQVTDGYGPYEINYREGTAVATRRFDTGEKPKIVPIFFVDKFTFRGVDAGVVVNYVPRYNRKGEVSDPLRTFVSLHELSESIKEEVSEAKSSLAN